ncbi:TadE family type IV pilus minor pilin [Streptomyces asoensis]
MCRGDRGFVTAESAVVLPVLALFATALVYGLLIMSAQIRCVDAARAGARAAARQDAPEAILEVTRAVAPRGAEVTVGREGDQVRVVVVARPPALRVLPVELREEAVAAAEEALAPAGETAGTAATGTATPGTAATGKATPGTAATGKGEGMAR